MEENDYFQILKQIKINTIDILKDRGYEIIKGEREYFENIENSNIPENFLFSNIYEKKTSKGIEKLCVYFFTSENIIKGVLQKLILNNIISNVFVDNKINTFQDVSIQDFISKKDNIYNKVLFICKDYAKNENIENLPLNKIIYIRTNQLLVNVTKHCLNSKVRLLDSSESSKFNKNELPRIQQEDPIVFWYDFPKGSILEFTRNSLIPGIPPGKEIYYRVVT